MSYRPPLQCISQLVTARVTTSATIVATDAPSVSNGAQFATVTIVPRSAQSKLYVCLTAFVARSAIGSISVTLFRDGSPIAGAHNHAGFTNASSMLTEAVLVDASSTASTTFTARFGLTGSGTLAVINGNDSVQFYPGYGNTSLTVQEFLP